MRNGMFEVGDHVHVKISPNASSKLAGNGRVVSIFHGDPPAYKVRLKYGKAKTKDRIFSKEDLLLIRSVAKS